jgi:hypothetical protein
MTNTEALANQLRCQSENACSATVSCLAVGYVLRIPPSDRRRSPVICRPGKSSKRVGHAPSSGADRRDRSAVAHVANHYARLKTRSYPCAKVSFPPMCMPARFLNLLGTSSLVNL